MGKHFSFIHCADLHLGEPFEGIYSGGKGPWINAIGKSTFKAFSKVVDAAIENRVDAILISGDVYNSDHHSLSAQLNFARELYRAAEAGIQAFIIHGNHDPGEAWIADIPLPETVHIFGSDGVEAIPLMKDGEKAAVIYGISYKTRRQPENLARLFHKNKEDPFAIGMLHTEVGEKDGVYAPCSKDDLIHSGMDYWALGHVHTRVTLDTRPYIVYPGNTQGLDMSEQGPRGCYLVDVGQYGTVSLKFIETDAIRWMTMTVDVSAFRQVEEVIAEIVKRRASLKQQIGRPCIIRLVFKGSGPLHQILRSEEGREYILQTLNNKEQFRFIFAYFADIKDESRTDIDLKERREIPDVLGSYLLTYDSVNHIPHAEKMKKLREMIASSPELSHHSELMKHISDGMLENSFKKAELLGAEILTEDENEDN